MQFISQARMQIAQMTSLLFQEDSRGASPNLNPGMPQANQIQMAIAEIQQQDKQYEIMMKQIDSQHQAVQTEMEGVQKVIQNNIEGTFKTFNA